MCGQTAPNPVEKDPQAAPCSAAVAHAMSEGTQLMQVAGLRTTAHRVCVARQLLVHSNWWLLAQGIKHAGLFSKASLKT